MTDAPIFAPPASEPGTRRVRRTPSVDDDLRLREAAGASAYPREAAERGLPSSLIAGVVELDAPGARAVGMGRVVGDGGLHAQATDIAVEPEFQGRGPGQAIMSAPMTAARAELAAGLPLNLIADLPADRRHARHGFVPAAPRSIAMAQRPA